MLAVEILICLWLFLSGRSYGLSATDEEGSHAITKAQELAEKLDSGFPIFVKPITKSYVNGNFKLVK